MPTKPTNETIVDGRLESSSPIARKADLAQLLERLKGFTSSQLDYFQALAGDNPLLKYPAARITSQFLNDLEALERATVQRQPDAPAAYHEILELADQLAYRALQPAAAWLPEHVTAITYIHKAPMARVVPYAPVALVGIPYTVYLSRSSNALEPRSNAAPLVWRDLLALPHEIGHYVFWHARVPVAKGSTERKPLFVLLTERLKAKSFATNPDTRRWLEEIFADVYGCVLGGPIIALAAQDLQLNRSLSEFTTDDAEHPIPYFRPRIYQQVLDKYFRAEYGAPVRARWEQAVLKRPYVPRIFDGDRAYPLNETRITGELETIVEEIRQVLYDLPDFHTMNRDEVLWPRKTALGMPTGDINAWLSDRFEGQLDAFSKDASGANNPPLLSTDPLADTIWQDLRQRFRDDAKQARAAGMVFEPTLSGLTADQVAELWAGGWATKGPEEDWP